MMEQSAPPFVFLSHARADEEYVHRLMHNLQAHGIAVWIDRHGIPVGTPDWEETIRTAIARASAVVLVASPRARASLVVRDELDVALQHECPIYPFWIDGEHWIESIPLGWGRMQRLDARQSRYETAQAELITLLQRQLRSPYVPGSFTLTQSTGRVAAHSDGDLPAPIISEYKNGESMFPEDTPQTFSVGGQKVNLIILARGDYGPQEVQCFYERKRHLPPDLEEMRKNYARNVKEQKAKGILGLPYDSPMYKLREFDVGHRNIIDGEEVPHLLLKFSPTDYFSQIVTDLNVGDPVREKYLARADLITQHPVPEFSTILGVNLNIITADNYLILTERSRQAKVAGGRLHTSVGENLLRPKDSGVSYAPDPFLALTRGTKEELGIILNKDEIVFRTFTVIPDFCQYSLIATRHILETHSQVEEIWRNVVPADKWENRRLQFFPHHPDTIAQFVVSTWERWFHVALAAVVLSLLDVGYTWEEVDMAFLEARSKLSL
jgi:hypothetical protein